MHGSRQMTAELIDAVKVFCQSNLTEQVDVLICPPSIYLPQATELTQDSPLLLGAQNVSAFEAGAHTGEISLPMLQEVGCDYVILGHSERRELYAESSEVVADKFRACIANSNTNGSVKNVKPILCVGETLEQREKGETEAVISSQLDAVLAVSGIDGFNQAVIAYEPVWAIGTGQTASPEQAQQVHAFIRSKLGKLNVDIAQKVQILYGGSVKPDNAQMLFSQPDIDGGLIGGASLKADDFIAICSASSI